ncbi:FAD-dependent oxidoreductase [Caenimonas koreensis]|uniref:FAD-dependent oxidoreductase n=1 Tax=Caenimonas koreensis TaxID=367474 RepID=UPI002B272AE5|nr:FAD-dependent oxidoreductase [Caenimonas koreensis]
MIHRRQLLQSIPWAAGALAPFAPLTALADDASGVAPRLPFRANAPLAKVRAEPDRLIDFAVCTRPFRPQGPRIEAQQLHGKHVVHHYGHGGSGWSLSWGSARQALPLILATRDRHIAIIGCGAIGLTTARVAQRAGLRVRIYCKERPPEVRSSAATGVWSPDSRLYTEEHATPPVAAQWERMARSSFKTWQSMLGLPGEPVEWHDAYVVSDTPFEEPLPDTGPDEEPEYAELEERVRELRPRLVTLRPGEHPFKAPHARRFAQLVFNLATYQRLLMDDFLREGGEIEQRDFVHARQIAGLRERTIVNCTGYGAKALFGDKSIVPVRGQTARLIPQPQVDYALYWRGHNLAMVPRRDGLLVQAQGPHDYNNEDTQVDRALSEDAVRRLAGLMA